MSITTEQVHNNLKGVLLNGRILVNGLPLNANEMSSLIQGEQMLFEKAMQFDKAPELAAKKEIPKKGGNDGSGNIVKFSHQMTENGQKKKE